MTDEITSQDSPSSPEQGGSPGPARGGMPFRLPATSGPLLGLIAVTLLFVVLIGVKGEPGRLNDFLSLRNLQVLVQGINVPAVMALGMLLIIISGGIDLSAGAVIALVTVTTMQTYRLVFGGWEAFLSVEFLEWLRRTGPGIFHWKGTQSQTLSSLAAVPVGVLMGGLCGWTNGMVITRLRVSPFVATLGMLSVARGLAYWLSGRRPVDFPAQARPRWVDAVSEVHPAYTLFNLGIWSFVVLALLVALLLRSTVLGRYCYAIGSNELTARLCGVAVERNKVVLYTLAGLLTGWAGIIMFAQIGSGDPGGGMALELEVIAAVVIGGASLSGGQGTVLGTVLGILILGVLSNGVSLFNVPVEMRYILIGAIIVANTALSQWQRRKNE